MYVCSELHPLVIYCELIYLCSLVSYQLYKSYKTMYIICIRFMYYARFLRSVKQWKYFSVQNTIYFGSWVYITQIRRWGMIRDSGNVLIKYNQTFIPTQWGFGLLKHQITQTFILNLQPYYPSTYQAFSAHCWQTLTLQCLLPYHPSRYLLETSPLISI